MGAVATSCGPGWLTTAERAGISRRWSGWLCTGRATRHGSSRPPALAQRATVSHVRGVLSPSTTALFCEVLAGMMSVPKGR